MKLEIRRADRRDLPDVLDAMRRFAELVGFGEYLTVTEEQLSEAVFGDDGFVEMLVAYDDSTIAGFAVFYRHFSSFRGERGYYLEDIFVEEDYRGRGVGFAMIKEIARQARALGYERIDFQVLSYNAGAIKFYERLGAVSNMDEVRFKFSGEAFDRLAE